MKSCGVSSKSTYDKELMVIYGSNKNDGFIQLIDNNNNGKNSSNSKYNEFVKNMCPDESDEFIFIFKLNFFIIFSCIVKLFIIKIKLFLFHKLI